MKYSEYPYKRPDIITLQNEFSRLLDGMDKAASASAQVEYIRQINKLRIEFETLSNIVYVRHTVDTTDKFYENEQEFFDTNSPHYQELINKYYKKLTASPFRNELERTFGKQLFTIAELTLKTFDKNIIEDLQKENKLSSEYTKLLASAKINFEGEERNLSGLAPFEQSIKRSTRKNAAEAKFGFFSGHRQEFDRIYDELVTTRTIIAKKLGYENFIQLAYNRMLRSEYDSSHVSIFRKLILEYIVPLNIRLKKEQAQRLNVDALKYYDEPLLFHDGNPLPQGNPAMIVENAIKMYDELSHETSKFIHFMNDNELLDLVNRKGKAPGGYCTIFAKYKAPFIFSNFNGTAGDIYVLTHEAGHAFQMYSSMHYDIPEYYFPTYEACEIHSMSMEYFTWNWMHLFFGEDAEKYKHYHVTNALLFLAYSAAIDEFQHAIYEIPDMTPEERHNTWRNIEMKYLPDRDYDGNEYLEKGGFWQKQSHVYNVPFYYIDYSLALICAFQFWIKSLTDMDKAFKDYVILCGLGGSLPFLELVKKSSLESPFNPATFRTVTNGAANWLIQGAEVKQ